MFIVIMSINHKKILNRWWMTWWIFLVGQLFIDLSVSNYCKMTEQTYSCAFAMSLVGYIFKLLNKKCVWEHIKIMLMLPWICQRNRSSLHCNLQVYLFPIFTQKNQKLMFCYCLHRLTSFEVPYTFNIHDSPVTCTQFCSDCPSDFLKALGAAVGGRSKKRQFHRENSQQVS